MATENALSANRAYRLYSEHPIQYGIIALALLFLLFQAFGADNNARRDAAIAAELDTGEVTKIAEAPDGATVWAIKREGKVIYFSKGTMVQVEEPTT